MAYIVMAYIVIAYIVIAYIVMAYIVMAFIYTAKPAASRTTCRQRYVDSIANAAAHLHLSGMCIAHS